MPAQRLPHGEADVQLPRDRRGRSKVAIANGVLDGVTRNPPDSDFPRGSATWNWDSPAPSPSYLVQSSIGIYSTEQSHVGADGVDLLPGPGQTIAARNALATRAILDQQEEVTNFQSRFNGPYPFTSDGRRRAARPTVDFEEEMQTMISFNESIVQLPVLWHDEHAPVVGRQRQPRPSYRDDVLQGGPRRMDGRATCSPRAPSKGRRIRAGARSATFDRVLRQRAAASGRSAPLATPYAYHAFRRPANLRTSGRGLRGAAQDPRGLAASTPRCSEIQRDLRRRRTSPSPSSRPPSHKRSRTGVAACRRAPGAVLRRMVRHRLRARRRRAAPADHRSRARGDELLRSRRRLSPRRAERPAGARASATAQAVLGRP